MLVPINPDHSLAQRLAYLGQPATYSRELSSAEEVGELFLEPHSRKHLHIVVQCEILAPSGPSGKYRYIVVLVRVELTNVLELLTLLANL